MPQNDEGSLCFTSIYTFVEPRVLRNICAHLILLTNSACDEFDDFFIRSRNYGSGKDSNFNLSENCALGML